MSTLPAVPAGRFAGTECRRTGSLDIMRGSGYNRRPRADAASGNALANQRGVACTHVIALGV